MNDIAENLWHLNAGETVDENFLSNYSYMKLFRGQQSIKGSPKFRTIIAI